MSLRTSCPGFAILGALLLLARVGGAAETRADHAERLARGSELAVKALIDVKLQLLRTMDAYNALLPPHRSGSPERLQGPSKGVPEDGQAAGQVVSED
jgi:hypothetical protein